MVRKSERGKKNFSHRSMQVLRKLIRKLRSYTSFPIAKTEHEKPTKRVDLRFKYTGCEKVVFAVLFLNEKFELI